MHANLQGLTPWTLGCEFPLISLRILGHPNSFKLFENENFRQFYHELSEVQYTFVIDLDLRVYGNEQLTMHAVWYTVL